MSKKQSLAAALQSLGRSEGAQKAPQVRSQTARHAVTAATRTTSPTAQLVKTASTQAPSRHGKKALIGYFEPAVSKQLRQLALDRDTTVQELLREAVNDLFQKNSKPAIA
jgi:hypothetical protein